jgi:hypothetical protein
MAHVRTTHSDGYRRCMDVNKIKGKAQTFIKDHGEQIETGVSKAEKFAKSKSAKHDAKIDKVAGKIRGLIPPDEKRTDGEKPGPQA